MLLLLKPHDGAVPSTFAAQFDNDRLVRRYDVGLLVRRYDNERLER